MFEEQQQPTGAGSSSGVEEGGGGGVVEMNRFPYYLGQPPFRTTTRRTIAR